MITSIIGGILGIISSLLCYSLYKNKKQDVLDYVHTTLSSITRKEKLN